MCALPPPAWQAHSFPFGRGMFALNRPKASFFPLCLSFFLFKKKFTFFSYFVLHVGTLVKVYNPVRSTGTGAISH